MIQAHLWRALTGYASPASRRPRNGGRPPCGRVLPAVTFAVDGAPSGHSGSVCMDDAGGAFAASYGFGLDGAPKL
jgi:hypothetical protein